MAYEFNPFTNNLDKVNKSGECSFDGVYTPPSGNVSGATACDFVALHFPSQPPTCQLSASPAFGLRELGDDVVNPTISIKGNLGSNPAGTLTLADTYRGNYGTGTLVGSYVNPTPGVNNSDVDNFTVANDQYYRGRVSDDQGRNSNICTGQYRFTYPYFVGIITAGDITTGITEASIMALPGITKLVKTQSTTTNTTSPASERYVILYPASYSNLSSIIDDNGFETLSDFTLSTINITSMLDGTTQSYKMYQLNADTTQTSFTNTYYH